MAAKPKLQKQPEPSSIGGLNYRWEYTANGNVLWTHTPPTKEQVSESGPVKWRPIWCAGYEVDEKGERHYHHIDCIPCHCPPGPQIQALWADAREVALWGGRGSAKSEITFAFLTCGNHWGHFDPQNMRPVDLSFINCPDYTFLVLRKNAKDLKSYFERAKKYFGLFGGVPTDAPMGIRFPGSGAYGIFDHMADGDAWEKYQGPEWTRMVVEEAPQIPDEKSYLKLIAACRTSHPNMQSQVMLTANPGGKGWPWFKARFIYPDGRRLASNTPYTEPFSGRKRVAIYSTVDDNPLNLAKGYDKDLDSYKSQSNALYLQWRHGDPDAAEGKFFEMFRERKLANEPANALHVIKPVKLDPYWPRAIGGDWGYSHKAAFTWGCWHPEGRLHAYREYVTSHTGAVEMGAQIALRSMEDLLTMPDPHMTLYLSHDAFARRDETNTFAEQIAQGINSVFQDEAAFVLAPNQDEETLEDRAQWESVLRRQRSRCKNTHITIANASRNTKSRWNLMRDYMRWWPLPTTNVTFSEGRAREILMNEGALAYKTYKDMCERNLNETLPKLQIWDCCPELIGSIQSAIEDENDREAVVKQDGDDPLDSAAHLVGNFTFAEAQKSKSMTVSDKLSALRVQNPGISTNSLIMASHRAEAQYDRTHHASHGFTIPRSAGPTRRRWMAGKTN